MKLVTAARAAKAEALRKERIRMDQERRRSNVAMRHTNRARAAKRPGKGNRSNWQEQDNG